MQREGGCAVVRQAHIIAAVGVLLMGCTILLVVGCAGVRSQAPQKEEQARSDRCEGTRTFKPKGSSYLSTTNDLPGCPNKGGLLSGTDKADDLDGKDGDDEIHGLGGYEDFIDGGLGNDVIYGGPGTDYINFGGDDEGGDDVLYGDDGPDLLWGAEGEDVLYGGKGNDSLDSDDQFGRAGAPPMRDELYCGPGKDEYHADRLDYVDSSCEEKVKAICCFGLGVGDGVTVSWRVPIAPVQSGQGRRRAST
jgi:Ca2+-binding RTX toxin-like protein